MIAEIKEEISMVIRRPGVVTIIPVNGEPYEVAPNHNYVTLGGSGEKRVTPAFLLEKGDSIISTKIINEPNVNLLG